MKKSELIKKYEVRMKEAVAYVDKFWPYEGLSNEKIQIIKEIESKIMIYHEILNDLNDLEEEVLEQNSKNGDNTNPFFSEFNF